MNLILLNRKTPLKLKLERDMMVMTTDWSFELLTFLTDFPYLSSLLVETFRIKGVRSCVCNRKRGSDRNRERKILYCIVNN